MAFMYPKIQLIFNQKIQVRINHLYEPQNYLKSTRKIPVRCNGIYIVKLSTEFFLGGHKITHIPKLLNFLFILFLTNYQGIKSLNFIG
jgi:hypothetical protein